MHKIYYSLPVKKESLWRFHRIIRQNRTQIRDQYIGVPIIKKSCEIQKTYFKSDPILFSGYKKSGNTWFRLILFNYIRKLTKNIDGPLLIRDLNEIQWAKIPVDFKKLNQDNTEPLISFIRTHYIYNKSFNIFNKRIHIVRNPLDCLISNYFWLIRNRAPIVLENMALPGEKESLQNIDYFINAMYDDWALHTKMGVKNNYIFKYEDLVFNPVETMENILNYLDLELDSEILQSALNWSDFGVMKKLSVEKDDVKGMGSKSFKGEFYRKGKVGEFNEKLKKETIEKIFNNVESNRMVNQLYPVEYLSKL